ncbi:hypothetical protein PIB30_090220, partial [Stylosanthes scabra]|nr:hypothetical protein [Stylosanthes scabra]
MEWTARNGVPAPCPSRARALDVDFVIKKRVARPRGQQRFSYRPSYIVAKLWMLAFHWLWNQVIWTS